MYVYLCVCFAVDETPENPPEPEVTAVDTQPEETTPELRCDEELDDGKSTEFPVLDA